MIYTWDQIPGMVETIFTDMKPAFFNGLLISFILAMALILIWMPRKGWRDFSVDRKWPSRVVVFILSLFIAVPTLFLPANTVSDLMFGKIAMESPNFTATAIKLVLYGFYRNYQIASQMPPEKRDLVGCVAAISRVEAQNFQKKCSDDPACFTNIPVMRRETILAKMKEATTTSSSEAHSACETVNVSKITPRHAQGSGVLR